MSTQGAIQQPQPTPPMPEWADTPFLQKAVAFATRAHEGQTRKYTGEPYIVHPIEVATLFVETLQRFAANELIFKRAKMVYEHVIAAAVLHDTVEDCNVTFTEIDREFGEATTDVLMWLTDTITKQQGNRATRKRLEAQKLAYAPLEAKLVKLCDNHSNTKSIVENDPDFAVAYLREKEYSLRQMRHPEPGESSLLCACFYHLYSQALGNTIL
jgi:(p)ppGpp synthase/HD superfamily hydrolase